MDLATVIMMVSMCNNAGNCFWNPVTIVVEGKAEEIRPYLAKNCSTYFRIGRESGYWGAHADGYKCVAVTGFTYFGHMTLTNIRMDANQCDEENPNKTEDQYPWKCPQRRTLYDEEGR